MRLKTENEEIPILLELKKGDVIKSGRKIYGRCPRCDIIIRLNKFLLGSAHVCL